jgi:Domain of unknown function (DUF4333)
VAAPEVPLDWDTALMIRVATAALAVALVAAGCGGTVIDDVKTADTIQRYLERSKGENVKSVDCPSNQEVEAGATFECEAVLANGERKIATVEIRNEDADFSVVSYKPKR